MKIQLIIGILVLSISVFSQEIIDVSVKGISDSKNDGAQQDRLEAILDAKIQACEKAGMKIESKTEVENFQTVYDYIEASSKSVLLPGFQIIDIGYTKDDTYQVVLTGKLKKIDEDGITNKVLRYAKSLYESSQYRESMAILEKLIKDKDNTVPDEHKEQAYYLLIRWGYAFNVTATFNKFKAYYPKSKYLKILTPFIEKTKSPLYEHKLEKVVNKKDWKDLTVVNGSKTYDEIITLENDTISFKDLDEKVYKITVKYTLHKDKKSEAIANSYSIFLHTPEEKDLEIIDRFKTLSNISSTSYHISSSNKRLGDFSITNILLKGSFPLKEDANCSLTFSVKQIAF